MRGPVAATMALAVMLAAAAAADDADWRWREPAADSCAGAGPERVLEAYMGDDRTAAGIATWRPCGGGKDQPAAAVRTHFRFVMHFSALPDREIAVDHRGLEWRDGGVLLRASASAKGDDACGQLFGGECKLELTPAPDGGWVLLQHDAHGTTKAKAPPGAAIDDFWGHDQVTAPELANLYSGRLWRIETRSGPEPDSVGGRAAQRYRIESESQGFLLFRARFARTIWFAADGQVLRVCNYQQDLGVGEMAEFVRKDLGMEPGHDCARWLGLGAPS